LKTIYDLELHETMYVGVGNEFEVTKVHNGFLYYKYPHQLVFVPYEGKREDTGPK